MCVYYGKKLFVAILALTLLGITFADTAENVLNVENSNQTDQEARWDEFYQTFSNFKDEVNLLAAVGSPLPPDVRPVTGPFGRSGRPAVEFTPQSYVGRWAKDLLPLPFYKNFGIKVTIYLQSILGGVLFSVVETDHSKIILGLNVLSNTPDSQRIEFIYQNPYLAIGNNNNNNNNNNDNLVSRQLTANFVIPKFERKWTVFSLSIYEDVITLYFNGCDMVLSKVFTERRNPLKINGNSPVFIGMAGWYITKPALFGAVYDLTIFKDHTKAVPTCAKMDNATTTTTTAPQSITTTTSTTQPTTTTTSTTQPTTITTSTAQPTTPTTSTAQPATTTTSTTQPTTTTTSTTKPTTTTTSTTQPTTTTTSTTQPTKTTTSTTQPTTTTTSTTQPATTTTSTTQPTTTTTSTKQPTTITTSTAQPTTTTTSTTQPTTTTTSTTQPTTTTTSTTQPTTTTTSTTQPTTTATSTAQPTTTTTSTTQPTTTTTSTTQPATTTTSTAQPTTKTTSTTQPATINTSTTQPKKITQNFPRTTTRSSISTASITPKTKTEEDSEAESLTTTVDTAKTTPVTLATTIYKKFEETTDKDIKEKTNPPMTGLNNTRVTAITPTEVRDILVSSAAALQKLWNQTVWKEDEFVSKELKEGFEKELIKIDKAIKRLNVTATIKVCRSINSRTFFLSLCDDNSMTRVMSHLTSIKTCNTIMNRINENPIMP